MQNRRQFLGSTALAATAAALPSLVRGQSSGESSGESGAGGRRGQALPPTPILVDWHSHYTSNAEIQFLRSRKSAPRVFEKDGKNYLENLGTVSGAGSNTPGEIIVSDVPARLANLDANNIKRQLLAHTVPRGFDATIPVDELKILYRAYNDELAGVVRAHPDRFFGVAALPAADPVWAAEELTRAHKELGLIGASLPLNAFTSLEGARTLAPVFAAGNKLRSHFFIHRGPASSLVPGQPPLITPTDTDYARWALTVTGMMATFGALGSGDIASGASRITGGVGEALIATACGLLIAIISLFPFNVLNAHIDTARQEIADASHALEIIVKKTESVA